MYVTYHQIHQCHTKVHVMFQLQPSFWGCRGRTDGQRYKQADILLSKLSKLWKVM